MPETPWKNVSLQEIDLDLLLAKLAPHGIDQFRVEAAFKATLGHLYSDFERQLDAAQEVEPLTALLPLQMVRYDRNKKNAIIRRAASFCRKAPRTADVSS